MVALQGMPVDVRTLDGVADAYLACPDDGAPHPGVLVIQDGFGVRPGLRALADRIAAHGYTVLLPNAYYRHGPAPVIELPDFIDPAERPEIFQRVFPMIRELTPELVRSDAAAYLDWLAAALAVLIAAMVPERVAAVAGFHGGPLVTDAPDSPHLTVGNISGELYFGHAGRDEHMTPEHIARFDEALAAAGVRYRTEVYEGAQHGFTQVDTSAYDSAAAERHYRELLALFDRTLSTGPSPSGSGIR